MLSFAVAEIANGTEHAGGLGKPWNYRFNLAVASTISMTQLRKDTLM